MRLHPSYRLASLVAVTFTWLCTTTSATVLQQRDNEALEIPPMSPLLTPQHVIDYLHKGHVVLRDILTAEFRAPNFLEEYQRAEQESSKEFETFFLKVMKCERDTELLQRWNLLIQAGSGKLALKECTDYILEKKEERRLELEEWAAEGYEYDEEEDWDELDAELHPPFYQLNSVHQHSPQVYQMATSEKVGMIAATLMQVARARLYQTRSFQKIPSDQEYEQTTFNHLSYMHADLEIVPLDTNAYITIWCPATRNLTREDSVLTYATGSHNDIARTKYYDPRDYYDEEEEEEEEEYDDEEEYEQEEEETTEQEHQPLDEDERLELEYEHLKSDPRYNIEWYDDLNVGDCVAHHGWLMHGSTSQISKNGMRDAITFQYIDGRARKIPPAHERRGKLFRYAGETHFQHWYHDIDEGAVVDHPELPLVWPPQRQEEDEEEAKKVGVEDTIAATTS